ncbi:hypothetical protein [Roseospira navarrensis]|uniref:Uncharacterized protein n=1 Tax=Roseospira navarrensis TaxID=140058 RepID=A0A7X2D5R0_9PROT|nr:hypothetical protein [Roseospira navarrensis]MQX37495.1 hypothetical protein [Roseospira navarrensis]
MFPRCLLVALAALTIALPAHAQSSQINRDCEIDYRRCVMQARSHGGDDSPCDAYTACQAAKQCEAIRCACNRSGGASDPALQQEAQMTCNAVLKPHGGNSCDRYIAPCRAWSDAQHQASQSSGASGGPEDLLRPDELPR